MIPGRASRLHVHGEQVDEAVEDSLLVAFDAVGVGVRVGLVVVEAVAVQLVRTLVNSVTCPVCASRCGSTPGPGEFLLFLIVEVVWGGEDPASQVAGLGGPGARRGGAGFP